ncbi:hypothetical protein UCRPA7_720 [Phaeoacremonium minimum UCRPA7]|uniref:Uncharacterized protein n=1 Tax=Phaeoacremonium minimum (strain UCR-PA7) TaxID=1286976 RepID=R8BX45_PHAM7|nr:hypothetical protein UCRPA7_720 [Phaeoacremonium minimum UCRPA7]EOO03854.1 hypothetical protein UCRPA7_720 [Phaeoacremonium minimum UCRPA7]
MDRDSTTTTTTATTLRQHAQLPRPPPPPASPLPSVSAFAGDATSSRPLAPTSALHSPSRPVAARRPFAVDLPHLRQQDGPSSSNSQDTNTSNDTDTAADQVFTPPLSDAGMSAANGTGSGNDSSQESQLMHLSHIAAAQEKMHELEAATASTGLSRKRMADGVVKHTRQRSSASPVYHGGHSRNTSAVSIASTAGSRIGELSAELKTRLSYAMVKVNNGRFAYFKHVYYPWTPWLFCKPTAASFLPPADPIHQHFSCTCAGFGMERFPERIVGHVTAVRD